MIYDNFIAPAKPENCTHVETDARKKRPAKTMLAERFARHEREQWSNINNVSANEF